MGVVSEGRRERGEGEGLQAYYAENYEEGEAEDVGDAEGEAEDYAEDAGPGWGEVLA